MSLLSNLPQLHPILVNFTAALVPVSFFSDVLGRLLHRVSLRDVGWWTMLYAAAVTPLTAAAGWWWLRDMGGMDHVEMEIHMWLGTALSVLLLPLAAWRWTIQRKGAWASGTYLAAVAVTVLLLVVQGHLGGVMSFGADTSVGTSTSESGADGHSHSHGTQGVSPREPEAIGELQWQDAIDVGTAPSPIAE